VYLGAKPVFVDILEDSWCLDPAKVEASVTSKTKAILAVHIYGNLCDMHSLLEIGAKHGIPVIEDAAEAIGSQYQGKRAGSIGVFGSFSFHGTKTMTTGEGGMFVTNDVELYETVLTMSNHGRARNQTKQFWPDIVGFKYKISNVQAAIGCAQVERIDSLITRKREIIANYRELLKAYPEVSLNPESVTDVNGAWMPSAVFSAVSGVNRKQLQAEFCSANIDARIFFSPLSSLPMFEPQRHNLLAWDIPERAINLPSFHDMQLSDQERIVAVIGKVIAENRKVD
jgi:perosamine synthetase